MEVFGRAAHSGSRRRASENAIVKAAPLVRLLADADVRLTPRCDDRWADELLRGLCQSLDNEMPSPLPTRVVPDSTWPAYQLPPASKLASALQEGARRSLGRSLPLTVAGPSNIGNYLASLGVEATCGFGVVHRDLHAADEAIEVASIAKVYEAYRVAVRQLLLAGGQT